MRNDFCAFILTHGRPDRVYTYDTLRHSGYDGPVYLIVDDEDSTVGEYRARYGDEVIVFSKSEQAERFDEADNFDDRRAIVYARNACLDIARQLGYRHYVQLDDDYTNFEFRAGLNYKPGYWRVRSTLGRVFGAMVEYLDSSPILTIALSQGGDHIGWAGSNVTPLRMSRKAMNSFVFSVDRPLQFVGRVNEDVNTYTSQGRLGHLFFTVMAVKLVQKQTQTSAGGMTEMYLDSGTYLKSFYSVMLSPSCVQVGVMGDPVGGRYRLHHDIDWGRTAPMILREGTRRGADG